MAGTSTNSTANVSAGKPKISGAIYRAIKGTAAPTDAVSTLAAAYKPMGFVSSDGLVNSNNATTNAVKAWGGDTVLVVQTEKTDTLRFTLLETLNSDVLAAVFGSGNVTGALATGMTVKANADMQVEAVWVIDMVLTGNVAKRIVAPNAMISALADTVYKDDEAIGFGITLTCMPDSNGNTHYEYMKTGGSST